MPAGSALQDAIALSAVGEPTTLAGLLQEQVEELLEAFGPQTQEEAAQGGVIREQFLGAQAQETLEEHVPGALFCQLSVREVEEKP